MTESTLTEAGFDLLFRTARTANAWTDQPVPDDLLRQVHDIMRFGPTSANACPLRIVFVRSPEAKARLKPFLMDDNIEKTMQAPATAIMAHDMQFYDHLPKLFPHADARSWFAGNEKVIADTAFRNSSLQAAYFMIVARGFGLGCGPMSGFDEDGVNAEFFADGRFRVNFLCNLGFADHSNDFPRSPRFDFDDVCEIV
jgi:3-hydroxypropanoate dehydrogenase